MKVCLKVLQIQNLRYFIYGGVLIGWYRHNHKFIPVTIQIYFNEHSL